MKHFLANNKESLLKTKLIPEGSSLFIRSVFCLLLLSSPFIIPAPRALSPSHQQSCYRFIHDSVQSFILSTQASASSEYQTEYPEKAVWKVVMHFKPLSLRKFLHIRKAFTFYNGSGFAIGPHHFITNFHIVNRFEKGMSITLLRIKNGKMTEQREARILKLSSMDDLALLEVSEKVNNYLPIQQFPFHLNKNKIFRFMGYPFDKRDPEGIKLVTVATWYKHVFSARDKIQFVNRFRVRMNGMSGGPVLNENSEVIGVLHSGTAKKMIHAYAIPARTLNRFLNQRRDCRQLPVTKCIDREWEILHRKFFERDPVAKDRVSIFRDDAPFIK